MRVNVLIGSFAVLVLVATGRAGGQGITHAEVVPDDGFILGTRVNVDQAEIETARWASAHANSRAVREFAQSLLSGHSSAQNRAQVLAYNLRINLKIPGDTSLALSRRSQGAQSELRRLKGTKFDKAFLVSIRDEHAAEIDKVNSWYAGVATSDSVKAYLKEIMPTLVKHQQTAERLLGSGGKTVANR